MKERKVVFILTLMCAVLGTPLFAQPTAATVEALVDGGVYLDFVANGVASTRAGLTLTTNATNWGYPDTSDSSWQVNANCYDSKGNTGSDFRAVLSGLAPGGRYSIYLKSNYDANNYGYKWGLSSASEHVVTPLVPGNGIYVVGDAAGGKGTYLYLLNQEGFWATLGGEIVIYFGKADPRTQVDGLVVVLLELDPTYNPPPTVDAGPDETVYLDKTAQLAGKVTDEDPQQGEPGVLSYYWRQVSGPGTATFTPTDTTGVLDPVVSFSAKGAYELMLQATDGEKDANDVVAILVKDRADEFAVAYYPLDGDGRDATDHGYDLTVRGDTTFAAGMINQAASFDGDADDMVQVDPANPIGNVLNGLPGFSVSCWVKSNLYDTDKGFINFQFPTDGDNMGIRYDEAGSSGGGDAVLKMAVTTTSGVVDLETAGRSQSTNWQHVVMTWERGQRLRAYINGVETAYTAQRGPSPTDAALAEFKSLFLGRGAKDNDPNAEGWDGLIDEVRVYNFALPLTDEPQYDSVRSLTAMGPIVATVNAGADVEFNWRPGRTIQLDGSLADLGRPGEVLIMWDTVSGPNGATAKFEPADDLATTVSFDEGGVYVLKLSVFDEGVWAEDTVQVTAIAPTCAEVVADGLLLGMDLNKDCYVNLKDLVLLVQNWAECNDPEDTANCTWPW